MNLVLISVVSVLAAYLIVAHYRARIIQLNEFLEAKEIEREALYTFMERIGKSRTSENPFEMERGLRVITEFLVGQTGAEAGGLFVIEGDEDDRHLRGRVVTGLFPPLHVVSNMTLTKRARIQERVLRDRIRVGDGIVGLAASEAVATLIEDAQHDPRVPQVAKDFAPIESIMVAPLKIRDEVLGVMAVVNKKGIGTFTKDDLSILETLTNQASLTLNLLKIYNELSEKQRIEQELQLAREFQEMLLPKAFPEVPHLQIAGQSRPALEVGGDYYDVFMMDEHRMAVVIADVSGKGLAAGLIMASIRSHLRAESRHFSTPREVLRHVNIAILAETKSYVFVTMILAFIDLRTMNMQFCRAGHTPLVITDPGNGGYKVYQPRGALVGMFDEADFNDIEEQELQLTPGQSVVLFTDGVTEALSETGEEYGLTRFGEGLQAHGEASPEAIINSAFDGIDAFCTSTAQHDDITMVVVRATLDTSTASTLHTG